MENEQIKQYLIKLAEKTLNKCEAFTRVYGKDFVKQRLEKNLDKVYIDTYNEEKNGEYSMRDLSIRLFSHDKNTKSLTIKDIKSDFVLQHDVLHEAIHAVFRRTPEECEKFGIQDGTGIEEYDNNGKSLELGFNEGLTEWICKKAGYPSTVYGAESNIVELFELAIGEDNVMQLAKGDIKGNITELLQMSTEDVKKMLYKVDEIWQNESVKDQLERIIGVLSNRNNEAVSNETQEQLRDELGVDYNKYTQMMKTMGDFAKGVDINDLNAQLSYLREASSIRKNNMDLDLSLLKERIYLKYFNEEIENLQNDVTLSKEMINRLKGLNDNISEEEASRSPVLSRFKNEIYPELQSKYLNRVIGKKEKNTMDYNNVKLGLIDRFKVWKERREAEKNRAWRDNIEGETSEVDYSVADKLESDLLEQKRIKKATRDASKLYKSMYGKNNDGIGKDDFIEDYLVENGLKQKALPEPKETKRHSFMEQYPTEKSEEELAYERARSEKKMYYEIDGVKYEMPYRFSHIYFEQMQNGDYESNNFPALTTNDEVNYIINTQKMTPEKLNGILKRMIDMSLSEIGEHTYAISTLKPETELQETFPRLARQASANDYAANKIYDEGKVEDANAKLEKMAEKVLKFYQDVKNLDLSKDEQEERE